MTLNNLFKIDDNESNSEKSSENNSIQKDLTDALNGQPNNTTFNYENAKELYEFEMEGYTAILQQVHSEKERNTILLDKAKINLIYERSDIALPILISLQWNKEVGEEYVEALIAYCHEDWETLKQISAKCEKLISFIKHKKSIKHLRKYHEYPYYNIFSSDPNERKYLKGSQKQPWDMNYLDEKFKRNAK